MIFRDGRGFGTTPSQVLPHLDRLVATLSNHLLTRHLLTRAALPTGNLIAIEAKHKQTNGR